MRTAKAPTRLPGCEVSFEPSLTQITTFFFVVVFFATQLNLYYNYHAYNVCIWLTIRMWMGVTELYIRHDLYRIREVNCACVRVRACVYGFQRSILVAVYVISDQIIWSNTIGSLQELTGFHEWTNEAGYSNYWKWRAAYVFFSGKWPGLKVHLWFLHSNSKNSYHDIACICKPILVLALRIRQITSTFLCNGHPLKLERTKVFALMWSIWFWKHFTDTWKVEIHVLQWNMSFIDGDAKCCKILNGLVAIQNRRFHYLSNRYWGHSLEFPHHSDPDEYLQYI